jgi:hypothetical protein
MIRDGLEAYVEARLEFVRVAGGTRAEIDAFFERCKAERVAFDTRKVLGDGTVIEEIDGRRP